MVRMSDLVRGIVRDTPARPAEPPPVARPVEPAPPPRARVDVEASRPAVAPSEAGDPTALLGELQELLLEIRSLVRGSGAVPWSRLQALVDRAVTSLDRSPDLFWVANNPAAAAGADYLAFHQARVAVMALRIGLNVGYERRRLLTLGLAGCLIDVGLWQLPEALLRRLDTLAGDELAAYRSHPRLSADLVRRWAPPDEAIVAAILGHHEREQGQGFPQGLTGAAVATDAKILGLADTYTGLTVPPTARPRLRPHEAVREIVKSRHEAFPSLLIKALLSEISVFPPGTVVRLNTEEIGRVIAVNRNHPLRPRVEIMADGHGQRLPAPKTVDLSESPFIYITGPVTESSR
jgi:HD-GYP domain-containing protein (c-di-GMP phosphodiesterase class II)